MTLGTSFQPKNGLRQVDHFSPILFNTAIVVLSVLVQRAQCNGFIHGLADDLLDDGVVVIQYADDTIVLVDDNLEGARNLKFILCLFEQLTC